jgi:uncharacterized protein (TIGR04222 family)
LRLRLVTPCETIRHTLQTAGLLVGDPAVAAWRVLTVVAFGVILALAAMKVATGVSRDKPVIFLVLAGFVTLVTVIACMRNPPFRSQPGEQLLRHLRNARPNRRKTPPPQPGLSPVAGMAGFGVALYGLDALSGHPQYRHLQSTMAPSTGGGGSSCSSGCGSSGGDSGGSSCGGGGCGGCGGGD